MREFPFFEGMTKSAYITEKTIANILQDFGDLLVPHLTDTMLIRRSPAYQELFTDKSTIQQSPAFQELFTDKSTIQQSPAFQELQAQEAQKTEQATLLRLLRRRFGDLPEPLVERIEATTDRTVLEHWQNNMLEVSDLAEFEHRMDGQDSDKR